MMSAPWQEELLKVRRAKRRDAVELVRRLTRELSDATEYLEECIRLLEEAER